jgi:hypothetical protein
VAGIRGEVGKPKVRSKTGGHSAPREQHLRMVVLRQGVEAWLYSRVTLALLTSLVQLNDPVSTSAHRSSKLVRRFSNAARRVAPF